MSRVDLKNDTIGKLFFYFTFPAVTGMMVSALYVIVDGIFIGRGIGSSGLAAINIAYPITNFLVGLSLMFGVGGATMISIARGKNQTYEVNRIFTHTLFLTFVVYILALFVVILFEKDVIYFLGGNDLLYKDIRSYLIPSAWFNIFFMLSMGLNAIVRNDDAPKYAMFSMIVGAVINILLDTLFIIVFKWGMWGAAAATGIAQLCSFIFLMFHFYNGTSDIKIEKKLKLSPIIMGKIIINGFPSFIIEFAIAIVTLLFNLVLMKMTGEIGVAAFSIVAYVFYIFRMIFNGFSQGIQPIVSFNYGAGRYDRLKKIFYLGHKTSIITALFIIVIVNIFKENIVKVFTDGNEELIKLASTGLVCYTSGLIFLAVNFINISYLQSMEKALVSNLMSFGRSFFFVAAGIFIYPKIFGIYGVFLTPPIADFTVFAITTVGYFWKKKSGIKEKTYISQ